MLDVSDAAGSYPEDKLKCYKTKAAKSEGDSCSGHGAHVGGGGVVSGAGSTSASAALMNGTRMSSGTVTIHNVLQTVDFTETLKELSGKGASTQ